MWKLAPQYNGQRFHYLIVLALSKLLEDLGLSRVLVKTVYLSRKQWFPFWSYPLSFPTSPIITTVVPSWARAGGAPELLLAHANQTAQRGRLSLGQNQQQYLAGSFFLPCSLKYSLLPSKQIHGEETCPPLLPLSLSSQAQLPTEPSWKVAGWTLDLSLPPGQLVTVGMVAGVGRRREKLEQIDELECVT